MLSPLYPVPDDLVALAVQHGLGTLEGALVMATAEELVRLRVIAAPAAVRPRTAPHDPPARTRPLSRRVLERRLAKVAIDDRRARLANDVTRQRERLAAVRGAIDDLYAALGDYHTILCNPRSSDAQVADAHRRALVAHTQLERVQSSPTRGGPNGQ